MVKKVEDERGVKDKGLEADRKEKHLEEKFKAEETSDKGVRLGEQDSSLGWEVQANFPPWKSNANKCPICEVKVNQQPQSIT